MNTSCKKTAGAARKPVILQVIPSLGAGGAEQGCIDMTAAIVQAGATALVAAHGGARKHEIIRAGGTFIDLPVDSKSPWQMWRNARSLRKLIERYHVDIVHARSRAPAWSALRACAGTSARFMTTCHAPYNTGGTAKKFYNSSIARGERVIAISYTVAAYLRDQFSVLDNILRVIPRGIALEKFHPTAVTPERMIKLSRAWRLPDGANIILMPGRLTRWKGHGVLIEAMALLNRPDVFCVLIGDDQGRDQYRAELEALIAARNLDGSVRIVPHCDDMPAAYMLAMAVVSASTDPEGFGRVPVEAQAMGRPVIATDHGGAQETIKRGETGWLIPPNDPATLARALSEVLALTPMQRAVLATRAMAHVAEHFTREKMTDATLDVYAELLQESSFGQAPLLRPEPVPIIGSAATA